MIIRKSWKVRLPVAPAWMLRPDCRPEKFFFKIAADRLGNKEKFLNFAPLLGGDLPPLGQTHCNWLGAKEFGT